ncbi:MAG TPA: hypothetical protein PKE45_16155, partial [Caldilineaceae bacterium]|nr:hypothetical protein [Caldilineaceae bacterium]
MNESTSSGQGSASGWFQAKSATTAAGELVLLLTSDLKRYVVKLQAGRDLHCHLGIFTHDGLIGQPWGGTAKSSLGHDAIILEPSLDDLIHHLRRGTQIIYPKDAA